MRDPLKELIDQHRPEMDTVEPSDKLWGKIENAMILTPAIPAKPVSWFKYFTFGASAVTLAVVYSVTRPHFSAPNNPVPQSQQAITPVPEKKQNEKIISVPELKNTVPVAISFQAKAFAPVENAFPDGANTPQEIPLNLPPENKTESVPNEKFSYQSSGTYIQVDTVFLGITRLEINCTYLDATITGYAGRELKISGNLNGEHKKRDEGNSKYRIVYSRTDTVLHVSVTMTCDSRAKNKFVNINYGPDGSNLKFEVPENISVSVNNTYGNTTVSGLSGRELEIRSSSGNITADNIHSNPRLFATYGDICAKNITGNFYGRSSSGNATVRNVNGNVDVGTTYGDLEISQVTGNLKVTGSSGNIDLRQITGDANLTTTYGDITVDGYKGTPRFVSSSGSIHGSNIELTGNANFTTTYGDIEMELVNELDALSFDLRTTYGDLVIDKNGQRIEKENTLNLQKGSILIKAVSSSGSQQYR